MQKQNNRVFLKQFFHKYAKHPSAFKMFCDFFARIIEDQACFQQNAYQIIQDNYQYFLQPHIKERLFLLETPPRTGKSLLTTILGSVFIALNNPNQRGILITSNEKTRKYAFLHRIKALILHDDFLFITGLAKKDFIINDSAIIFPNGFIWQFQTTHSSNPIGSGFHWILLDDFMQYSDTISATKSETAHNILSSLLTRKEYSSKGSVTKIIVANQRLGFNDVSARFIESFATNNVPFIHLTMPYHFRIQGETTYKLFSGKQITFQQNDYLLQKFHAQDEKEIMSFLASESMFYTQYLQIATQDELTVFDVKHLQYYNDVADIENITNIFLTVDFAFKTKSHNDFTACIVWGSDLRDKAKPKLYVLDILHHKKLIADSIPLIHSLALKWIGFKGTNKWHSTFQGLYVEDVSSNEAVFPLLQQNAPNLAIRKVSRASNDKLARANSILPVLRQDCVFIPKRHQLTEALVNEIRSFTRNDSHKNDDLVDCFIDGLQYGLLQSGSFSEAIEKALGFVKKDLQQKNPFVY